MGSTPLPLGFGGGGGEMADRAAEEAVGAAFAAAIDVAIATPTPALRLEFFWRVIGAISANRVPAFVVVGDAVLPPTTAPALAGVRAGVVPPPSSGRRAAGSPLGGMGGGAFPAPPPHFGGVFSGGAAAGRGFGSAGRRPFVAAPPAEGSLAAAPSVGFPPSVGRPNVSVPAAAAAVGVSGGDLGAGGRRSASGFRRCLWKNHRGPRKTGEN